MSPDLYSCFGDMLLLSATRVSVNGLEPNSRYKLLVFAMNGVSELSGTKSSSYVVAVTDKAGESRGTSTHMYQCRSPCHCPVSLAVMSHCKVLEKTL